MVLASEPVREAAVSLSRQLGRTAGEGEGGRNTGHASLKKREINKPV